MNKAEARTLAMQAVWFVASFLICFAIGKALFL